MNQNPEQIARDRIDELLRAAGWILQDKKSINLAAGTGVAIRECQTDAGPVKFWPNPVSDALFIDIAGANKKVVYELYDLSGRAVKSGGGQAPFALSLKGLASGVYMVRVVDVRSGVGVKKSIVKN